MARRKPLVCQHLENISREALEEYQHVIRQYVRRRHGVYALYRRGKLYYVGLASNLRARLHHHLKDRHAHSWDRFSVYLTIGDSHLRELESLLLRIVQPKGNKQKGKFAKSEDLRRRVARDAKHSWQMEMQEMLGLCARRRSGAQPAVIDGRSPVLAAYIHGQFHGQSLKLRARCKGELLHATVSRTGTIRFNGKRYNSPSTAASSARGRSSNGWRFWRYERAPGDWVHLNELRK